ncbi:MAG: 16S rRNA (cytosine(1407)-C(5))-methyltransferase RsmF, partial [Deltaproteobacteria bacterium]|nr:16S rRNA (cytosine(1407)-C(5))-methyltransferase RsmF [Deltaproteobacteria bacterium]
RDLIRAAVAHLAPGGTLVYAVCTVTRAEGPDQLAWILETFPRLRLAPPDARVAPVLADLAPRGELVLWPHVHDTDGFYAARLILAEA